MSVALAWLDGQRCADAGAVGEDALAAAASMDGTVVDGGPGLQNPWT